MDDEYEGYEEPVPFEPSKFSGWMLVMNACEAVAGVLAAFSDFWSATAVNCAHAHNRKVELDERLSDGEKFASDILSGLDRL